MNKKCFFDKAAAFCGAVALVLGAFSCSDNDDKGSDNPPGPGPEGPGEFEGVELSKFVKATYEASGEYGIYTLTVSNEAYPAGMPAAEGEQVLTLGFCAEPSDDGLNVVLPDGTYGKGGATASGTWIPEISSIFVYTGEGQLGVEALPLSAGTVTVSHEGNDYTIVADIVSGDTELSYRYVGPVLFTSTGDDSGKWFDTPQDIVFEKADLRYYANWNYPHSDDTLLELYAGDVTITSDNNYQLNSGYGLYLPTYIFKIAEGGAISLPEGEYRVTEEETDALSAIPMTMEFGRMVFMEIWNEELPVGCYLTHIDPDTGMETMGAIVDGRMTVTASGADTRIEVDLITREGVSVKGTFSGNLDIQNRCDNSRAPKRPFTDLESDYKVNFPEDAYAVAYYMGEILYPDLGCWLLYVGPAGMEDEKGDPVGDFVQMEFLSELQNGTPTLPEGEYTISLEPRALSVFPGMLSWGETPVYGWYANLTSGAVNDTFAPFAAGTMTVAAQGDGYEISFAFEDDAETPHAITGVWNGPVLVQSVETKAAGCTPLRRSVR